MNAKGRLQAGPSSLRSIVPELEDAHARVTRIAEAFDVGDFEFVAIALPDLAADLWALVEAIHSQG